MNTINIFLDIDDTLVNYDTVEENEGYEGVPFLPGALQFIQENYTKGNKVYIISWYNSDRLDRMKSKYQWCFKNLPFIPYEHLIIVPAPSNKAGKAKEILELEQLSPSDYLIDDNEDNIKAWKEEGGTGILFDKKTMRWEDM